MLTQIYEIQTPREAMEMIRLGVDQGDRIGGASAWAKKQFNPAF